jgi:hypothetical protein
VQAPAWAADVAEMVEGCKDCHEVDEFKGMDAAKIIAASTEANAKNKKMAKATADISAEDLKAISEQLATEANK